MENNNLTNECAQGVHDFFLASSSKELCKSLGGGCEWKHYKIGTLVCKKCGVTKQIELDTYTRRH